MDTTSMFLSLTVLQRIHTCIYRQEDICIQYISTQGKMIYMPYICMNTLFIHWMCITITHQFSIHRMCLCVFFHTLLCIVCMDKLTVSELMAYISCNNQIDIHSHIHTNLSMYDTNTHFYVFYHFLFLSCHKCCCSQFFWPSNQKVKGEQKMWCCVLSSNIKIKRKLLITYGIHIFGMESFQCFVFEFLFQVFFFLFLASLFSYFTLNLNFFFSPIFSFYKTKFSFN